MIERILILFSLFILIVSQGIQYVTSAYKHNSLGNFVPDLAYDYIPKYDFSWLYYGEFWILILITIWIMFWHSHQKLSQILLAFGLFFLIRALCIVPTGLLTHPDQIIPTGEGFGLVHYLENDLFFSGHTGSPFLLALLFWNLPIWRYVSLIISGIMAYAVLSMRIHYSIDVIGAFFITYGIYHLSILFHHYLENIFSRLLKNHAEVIKNNPPTNKKN